MVFCGNSFLSFLSWALHSIAFIIVVGSLISTPTIILVDLCLNGPLRGGGWGVWFGFLIQSSLARRDLPEPGVEGGIGMGCHRQKVKV